MGLGTDVYHFRDMFSKVDFEGFQSGNHVWCVIMIDCLICRIFHSCHFYWKCYTFFRTSKTSTRAATTSVKTTCSFGIRCSRRQNMLVFYKDFLAYMYVLHQNYYSVL